MVLGNGEFSGSSPATDLLASFWHCVREPFHHALFSASLLPLPTPSRANQDFHFVEIWLTFYSSNPRSKFTLYLRGSQWYIKSWVLRARAPRWRSSFFLSLISWLPWSNTFKIQSQGTPLISGQYMSANSRNYFILWSLSPLIRTTMPSAFSDWDLTVVI